MQICLKKQRNLAKNVNLSNKTYKMDKFTKLAFQRNTVNKAIIISLTVGTVLNLINQGDFIFQMQWEKISTFKVLLTYLTPFCVSTYSTATALMVKMP